MLAPQILSVVRGLGACALVLSLELRAFDVGAPRSLLAQPPCD